MNFLEKIKKKFFIFFSIILSFLITIILNFLFFFEGTPRINSFKINYLIKNFRNNLIIFKNNLSYKFFVREKINYNQIFDYNRVEDHNFYYKDFKEIVLTPTPTNIVRPTLIFPTLIPTLMPTSTIYFYQPTLTILTPTPTDILKPTLMIPTLAPTLKIILTPTPIYNPGGAIYISNPLSQSYYNPKIAHLCYNPDNFIEYYANNAPKTNCYSLVRAEVEKNLTSVSILGKTITVHKKAYPAFKAVADKLKDFKDYRINTIGAYVFRCNVNASTSGKNDLCSSGCVLSTHSFGIAVDINWEENCNGCENFTMPIEIVDAFESYGFRWGGRYKSIFGGTIDAMHFEYLYDLCKHLN